MGCVGVTAGYFFGGKKRSWRNLKPMTLAVPSRHRQRPTGHGQPIKASRWKKCCMAQSSSTNTPANSQSDPNI